MDANARNESALRDLGKRSRNSRLHWPQRVVVITGRALEVVVEASTLVVEGSSSGVGCIASSISIEPLIRVRRD